MKQHNEVGGQSLIMISDVRDIPLLITSVPELKYAVVEFIKSRGGEASVKELNLRFANLALFRKTLRTLKEEGRIARSKTFGKNCVIVPCYRVTKNS